MDFEFDEMDSASGDWADIDDSESFLLTEKFEDAPNCVDPYAALVEKLHNIAPHISWRIRHDGTDEDVVSLSFWRVICVPVEQHEEATEIFERFMNGEDLTDYSDKDRYPAIYEKVGGERKLKSELQEFYDLLVKYEYLITSPFNGDLESLLNELSALLSRLYHLGTMLPDTSCSDAVDNGNIVFYDYRLHLPQLDEIFYLWDSYEQDVKKTSLSAKLNSILKDVTEGLIAIATGETDKVAAAFVDWRIGFRMEHGWGKDLLICLFTIHCAILHLRNQKRYGQ